MTSEVAITQGDGVALPQEPAHARIRRSPFPLRNQVPSMLQDDPVLCTFLDALDEVIAPDISVLDCFDGYLDARTAPIEMVRYLGTWVLASLDNPWDERAIRRDVVEASGRAKWAGTERALRDRLVPHEVTSVRIEESGSAIASTHPTDPSAWSDHSAPSVKVRIRPKVRSAEETARITRIVRGLVPAHVSVSVVVGN